MQFYDEVRITVASGKGGDGIASGRRESWIPFGGPSGGDGGDGGLVFFVASKDENTLIDYKYKKNFKAKPGEPWRTKDQYGAHGEDLELVMPVGTMVKDAESWKLLAQLEYDGQRIEILKGGEWGFGNIHFKDSIMQYPNYYLLWEPGQKKRSDPWASAPCRCWVDWLSECWEIFFDQLYGWCESKGSWLSVYDLSSKSWIGFCLRF